MASLFRFSPSFPLINWTTLFCLINEGGKSFALNFFLISLCVLLMMYIILILSNAAKLCGNQRRAASIALSYRSGGRPSPNSADTRTCQLEVHACRLDAGYLCRARADAKETDLGRRRQPGGRDAADGHQRWTIRGGLLTARFGVCALVWVGTIGG